MAAASLTISEEWVREKAEIQNDKLEDIRSLSLPGTYQEKITHLGSALKKFSRLKNLDLSRNSLQSLEGLENCKHLETLNLYYNNISTLDELQRLSRNLALKDIDLRLNPVTRNEPDYRLYLIYSLPQLEKLDDRAVRQSEKDTAASYFTSHEAMEDAADPPPPSASKVRSRAVPSRYAISTLDEDDRAVLDYLAKSQEKPNERPTGSSSKAASSEEYTVEAVRKMESEEYLSHQRSSLSAGSGGPPRRGQPRQDNTAPRLAPDGSARALDDSDGLYRKEMDAYTAYQGQGVFTPNPEIEAATPSKRQSTAADARAGGDANPSPLSSTMEALLDLVDKYWNGTKSLHTNQRFLKLASSTLTKTSEPSEKLSSLHDEILRLTEENQLLSNMAKQARNPKKSKDTVLPSSSLQEALEKTSIEVEMLKKKLQDSLEENKRLREHSTADHVASTPPPAITARAEGNLRREVEELRRESHHAQIRLKQYAQMQELATMLQESHKSLVHTNDHLLKEIEEMRRKHSFESDQGSPVKRNLHYATSHNGN